MHGRPLQSVPADNPWQCSGRLSSPLLLFWRANSVSAFPAAQPYMLQKSSRKREAAPQLLPRKKRQVGVLLLRPGVAAAAAPAPAAGAMACPPDSAACAPSWMRRRARSRASSTSPIPLTTSLFATSGVVPFLPSASMSSQQSSKRIIRGIVYDMDGTVVVPVIDFNEMRRRCGVVQGDILDVINSRSKEEQDRAYAIIAEIEEQALQQMKLMPGALELLQHTSSIPRGLITRNVMSSVHHFHNHHLIPAGVPPFIPAISRECNYEYKPSPQALLHICNSWGVSPSEVIMVGDSAKDDIVCGNRAGALTVLLDYNGMHNYEQQDLQGELRPTYLVRSLPEFHNLLQKEFQLVPPPHPHAAIEARDAR